jgi:integrase
MLQRDWSVFELLRVKIPERLPVVLSRAEVRQVLAAVRHPVRRVALTTIYALGLRLGEGSGSKPSTSTASV